MPGTGSAASASGQPFALELSHRLADPNREVSIIADRANMVRTGISVFSGDVEVRRGGRRVIADEARYDSSTQRLNVSGNVRYEDIKLSISGRLAAFDTVTDTGSFNDASFNLRDVSGRGSAARIGTPGDRTVVLDEVRYTTCPVGSDDWELIAPRITLDQEAGTGSGQGVRVEFKGVPILYAPFLSFPIDETRKSGILLPDVGTSDRSGTDISVPYYLNLAPNYDLTLTPRWLSKRGLQLKSDFRYLMPWGSGDLHLEYLPSDDRADRNRGLAYFEHLSDFGDGWRVIADVAHVSDDDYFEDLGSSLSGATQTHTERRLDLDYRGDTWTLLGRAQGFQTLDETIALENQPYEQLPQLLAAGKWDSGPFGLDYGFRSELVNFQRTDGVTGLRLDLEPTIGLSLGGPAYRLEPTVALRHTRYSLEEETAGQDPDASRTAPIFSVDGRMTFQRTAGKTGDVVQTLEPRVRYTHIPFRSQDSLPVFDSGDPDFNLVQLFRDNRFTGADRLGDTDQLSVGVTTRLYDSTNGRQFLTATIGQALYLSDRNVTLPGEPRGTSDASTLIAELEMGLWKSWNADLEYQWDPDESTIAKAAVRFQYRPDDQRVLNLAYRFRDDALEQTDVSFAWPIGDAWRLVARWNYSVEDQQTLERFTGLEYSRCCWSARLVTRRFVSNREGDEESGIFAQIELKGLTSVGARADSLLEDGILGYRTN